MGPGPSAGGISFGTYDRFKAGFLKAAAISDLSRNPLPHQSEADRNKLARAVGNTPRTHNPWLVYKRLRGQATESINAVELARARDASAAARGRDTAATRPGVPLGSNTILTGLLGLLGQAEGGRRTLLGA